MIGRCPCTRLRSRPRDSLGLQPWSVAGAQRLGMGATISLVFFPIFLVMIVFLTRRMLAEDR